MQTKNFTKEYWKWKNINQGISLKFLQKINFLKEEGKQKET